MKKLEYDTPCAEIIILEVETIVITSVQTDDDFGDSITGEEPDEW